MVEIKSVHGGDVLKQVHADSLAGADLHNAFLQDADLRGAELERADLQGAALRGADLSGANLERAEVTWAILSGADLRGANLRGADLSNSELSYVKLTEADLEGARLITARLVGASLARANLWAAMLNEAVLGDTNLVGAEMENCMVGGTTFINCTTLHRAKGLTGILHHGPSAMDVLTLRACLSELPEVFLQGVGYTREEITNLRRMYPAPIRYYSCFISHASGDGEFAARLDQDLRDNGVLSWHFGKDLRGGDYWRRQINVAIEDHDKLILVCSRLSLQRDNVVDEVLQALELQRTARSPKLFPIRLDDFIISEEGRQYAEEQVRQRAWPENWIRLVRDYQIPDFSDWKDPDAYQVALQRLLRDLEQPPTATGP